MNIENFNFKLSYETWDDVFTDGDVDNIFNSFLNTYLRAFNSSFPLRKIFHNYDNKAWLTAGIRISCQHKRNLHMLCKSTECHTLLAYYKKYSKILREVIKAAKRIYYNKMIVNFNNKSKTIWNIVNNEISKHNNNHDPPSLIKDGKKLTVVFILRMLLMCILV
jgi:hypothetical protein